ncbi:MAG TPA: carbohydrate ABC transporter permease [Streptosporangiaceae bacterium]|jgi:raffinose/stachyose/melibiose transport system permease protein
MSSEVAARPGGARMRRAFSGMGGGAHGLRRRQFAARLVTGLLIVVLFLLPVLYVVMISFEPASHFLKSPLTPSASLQPGNYSYAWSQADLARDMINTIIYAVVAAALATVLALFVAFPVARRLVRGSSFLYALLAVGLFLPIAYIPLFVEAQKLHLYNSLLGYTLLHVEPGMPLGVVLITAFIMSVPRELDEAAWVDGVSYVRYLFRVIAPMTAPALLITFLYGMIQVWNDIIGPVVLLESTSQNLFPLPQGVFSFYSINESDYVHFAAAIVIASLPLVVLFILTQRRLIEARISGAIKG